MSNSSSPFMRDIEQHPRVIELRERLAASEKEVERLNEEIDARKEWQSQHDDKVQGLHEEVERLTATLDSEKSRLVGRIIQEQNHCDNKLLHGQIRALEQRVSECEGLLRNALSHADDIDVYFERRKP